MVAGSVPDGVMRPGEDVDAASVAAASKRDAGVSWSISARLKMSISAVKSWCCMHSGMSCEQAINNWMENQYSRFVRVCMRCDAVA